MALKRKAFLSVIGLIMILLSACSNSGFQADTNYKVGNFSFINQKGDTVSLDDLKGKVWIADFIFTNCETVCPPMTFNLTKLQKELKDEGVEDYRIVSFSVDPENDTPEKLTDYISNFEANTDKWDLLTGYEFDKIKNLAEKSFKSVVANVSDSDQKIHGTSFYLVDQEGTVVKTYSGNSDVPYDEMVSDMKALIKEGKK
ncbi:SCO family protein [Rossellomorea marisflavi]|jgi:protein SCO1/2|uniref:SCO family protein n=1 Tax=Rossellomorea marisflavi TaxID=189381 RepID=UPI0009A87C35|nr:SCO family protein [Rossellomorea marisflavi]